MTERNLLEVVEGRKLISKGMTHPGLGEVEEDRKILSKGMI